MNITFPTTRPASSDMRIVQPRLLRDQGARDPTPETRAGARLGLRALRRLGLGAFTGRRSSGYCRPAGSEDENPNGDPRHARDISSARAVGNPRPALVHPPRLRDQLPDLDTCVSEIVAVLDEVDPGENFFPSGIAYPYIVEVAMQTGRMDLIPDEALERMVDSFPDLDSTAANRANRSFAVSYVLNVLGEIGAADLIFTPSGSLRRQLGDGLGHRPHVRRRQGGGPPALHGPACPAQLRPATAGRQRAGNGAVQELPVPPRRRRFVSLTPPHACWRGHSRRLKATLEREGNPVRCAAGQPGTGGRRRMVTLAVGIWSPSVMR